MIWYGDFHSSPAKSGGKGAGGSSGKGSTGSNNYSASFIVSLGDGPIAGIQAIINGNQIDFLATPPASVIADLNALGVTITYGNTYGATFMVGSYTQAPWSYLTSAHPTQALAYHGHPLACFPNMALGGSASLPNFNFEVLWAVANDIPSLGPDANPADWITYFLTSVDWGAGFPSALMGDTSGYRAWARATGMLVSPVVTSQQAAQSHLQDIMTATIAEFRWSSGLLTVVPLADAAVTGNGYTFAPNLTPIYDLTTNDFLENQGSLGSSGSATSVAVQRRDPSTVNNQIRVEYLDRSNLYNPVIVYDQDDAAIVATGRKRSSDVRQYHFFCLGSAASMSASMQMRREHIVTTYQFTLPPQFILIDPQDILTITEPNLGLVKQAVRVKEIQENSDGSLTFTAEEFLGAVTTPLYVRQQPLGAARNINADPGRINVPIMFEPTDQLAGALEVWLAVSGVTPAIWGGANVYASYDTGDSYALVGQQVGNARMGLLTAVLPTIAASVTGQTVDNTNTLSVTLAQSAGALGSGSVTDMLGLTTACYVGGEIIAYQTATLTGASAYSLAPMVRGAYGSSVGAHTIGSQFARLDSEIFKLGFTQDQIGQTVYIKFQSFNIYGSGLQDLAVLPAYAYTITGSALASPLPNVQNLRVYFEAGVMKLYWDEISDFRAVRYEIRKGNTWASGLQVATQAHPPFVTYGDDTYWAAAVSQPAAGLVVYSATPSQITVTGALLSQYIVKQIDEQATSWAGTFSSGVSKQGSDPTAFLALNPSGGAAAGTYDIPQSHWVDVGYVAACLCGASYIGSGSPTNYNILGLTDFLGEPDILLAGTSKYVDVHVEIAIAQTANTDVFALPDAFAPTDVFAPSITWGAWQKFIPGVYYGRYFKYRIVFSTLNSAISAYCLNFSFQVNVPSRTDHYLAKFVPSGGTTITFRPDGAAIDGAFNGGPNSSALPAVSVSYQQTTGDTYVITGLSTSQMTIQFFNAAGTAVARTADIHVQGF